MSIQGNINQSLGILGALYTQTDEFKDKQDIKSIKRDNKKDVNSIVSNLHIGNVDKANEINKKIFDRTTTTTDDKLRDSGIDAYKKANALIQDYKKYSQQLANRQLQIVSEDYAMSLNQQNQSREYMSTIMADTNRRMNMQYNASMGLTEENK